MSSSPQSTLPPHRVNSKTALKSLLSKLQTKPKRALSQNFLIDQNVLQNILKAADLSPGDLVIEIGPGLGALTYALLERGANVFAIEKDPILCRALQQFPSENLELLCADFRYVPLEEIVATRLQKGRKAKIISNIPYHLTSPILKKILPLHSQFSTAILMMQEEVARRCIGQVGDKNYSSLSLFVQMYTDPTLLFSVKRRSFYPVPSIDSAVLKLDLQPFPKERIEEYFLFSLIRESFSKRRKMLRQSLRLFHKKRNIEAILTSIGLSPLARPEELSKEDFLRFAWQLHQEIKNSSYNDN